MVGLSSFSTHLSETGDTTLVYLAIACLLYLSNFMECGDDITAVCESIRSGLLAAFVNCSPHFSDSRLVPTGMHTTVQSILKILKGTLPRYLTYRSAIEAVANALERLVNEAKIWPALPKLPGLIFAAAE